MRTQSHKNVASSSSTLMHKKLLLANDFWTTADSFRSFSHVTWAIHFVRSFALFSSESEARKFCPLLDLVCVSLGWSFLYNSAIAIFVHAICWSANWDARRSSMETGDRFYSWKSGRNDTFYYINRPRDLMHTHTNTVEGMLCCASKKVGRPLLPGKSDRWTRFSTDLLSWYTTDTDHLIRVQKKERSVKSGMSSLTRDQDIGKNVILCELWNSS